MASLPENVPTPTNKASGGVGVALMLLGGAIIGGASDLSEAGGMVGSVLSGKKMVTTETALSTFLIVGGLGGAAQSFLAGKQIEQIDADTVPVGMVYPAIIGTIVASAVVGHFLIPSSASQYENFI